MQIITVFKHSFQASFKIRKLCCPHFAETLIVIQEDPGRIRSWTQTCWAPWHCFYSKLFRAEILSGKKSCPAFCVWLFWQVCVFQNLIHLFKYLAISKGKRNLCLTPITVPFSGQPFRGTEKEQSIPLSITIIMTVPRFNQPQLCSFDSVQFQLEEICMQFPLWRGITEPSYITHWKATNCKGYTWCYIKLSLAQLFLNKYMAEHNKFSPPVQASHFQKMNSNFL